MHPPAQAATRSTPDWAAETAGVSFPHRPESYKHKIRLLAWARDLGGNFTPNLGLHVWISLFWDSASPFCCRYWSHSPRPKLVWPDIGLKAAKMGPPPTRPVQLPFPSVSSPPASACVGFRSPMPLGHGLWWLLPLFVTRGCSVKGGCPVGTYSEVPATQSV